MSKASSVKQVDVVSGATVTAVVITDGLMRTAIAVAKSRGHRWIFATRRGQRGRTRRAGETIGSCGYSRTRRSSWTTLLGEGSVRRLHLLNREVDEAFAKIGVGSPEPYAKAGVPEEDFIDLYAGLVSLEIDRQIATRRPRLFRSSIPGSKPASRH